MQKSRGKWGIRSGKSAKLAANLEEVNLRVGGFVLRIWIETRETVTYS